MLHEPQYRVAQDGFQLYMEYIYSNSNYSYMHPNSVGAETLIMHLSWLIYQTETYSNKLLIHIW